MIWRYHPPPQNGHLNYSVQDPHLPSSLQTPAHAELSYVILRLCGQIIIHSARLPVSIHGPQAYYQQTFTAEH